jgi:hypothetical protein
MRRVMQICLTLVGLALADGTSAWADEPHLCQACQEKLQSQQLQIQQQPHRHWFRGPRMCARCMQAQQLANGGPLVAPPMLLASNGGCTTCQAQVMNSGMMPGYAMAGQPAPANSNEPTPIGVMQATYRPAGAAGMAPGHAVSGSPGGMSPNDPSAMMNGRYVNTLAPTPSRRPHVLAHLFGVPTPDAVREHWNDKAIDAHASIPYGPYNSSVSELPSSMVYGR